MLPQLLSLRTLLRSTLSSLAQQPLISLHDLARSVRQTLGQAAVRVWIAMRAATFSTVWKSMATFLIRIIRACINALDWLLLPRLAVKLVIRNVIALIVLYSV